MANRLINIYNKEELKQKIQDDPTPRTTISFYRYVNLENPTALRDELFRAWSPLGVLGRIYLAKEGINAQFSVPTAHLDLFRAHLEMFKEFERMPFKIAVEDDGKSFYKLTIKTRHKIVADGLDDDAFDTTNVGKHLDAESWNEAMEDPNAIVVDMRNQYESEIGHFEGAITPDVDTFREELQVVTQELADKKDKKVLLYCTGGVRCEKASAYLKHHGFQDVNQLHGGIIDYARQIKAKGLANKFKGKNFVFDERLAETIGEEVIANCHQCDAPYDIHTNCANKACHLLFIQCTACKDKMDNTCSAECQAVVQLPIEEQRTIWAQMSKSKDNHLAVYKSRLRPNLKQVHKNIS
jgi:UPF0176 protein